MKLRGILDKEDAEPFTSEEYMNLYTYVSTTRLAGRLTEREAREGRVDVRALESDGVKGDGLTMTMTATSRRARDPTQDHLQHVHPKGSLRLFRTVVRAVRSRL